MKADLQLDKEPISKLFFKYYFPALTSLLSITAHQVIDGILLSHYVGKDGVAAAGLFGTVITFFIALILTLVIGGGISIGKNIGSKQYNKARGIFEFILSWTLAIGVIVVALAPIVCEDIVHFLTGSDNQLYDSTYGYTFWGFMWIPLFLIRTVLGNVISHDGAPKISRNATLVAALVNIVLDFIFIGWLDMGTRGASIATGIALMISCLYMLYYLYQGKGHISIRGFKLSFTLPQWKEIIRHGIPSLISELSFVAGLILINRSLVSYGSTAVEVFGIVNYASFIFLRLFTAALVSVLPIVSFNIGASLPERVIQTLKFSIAFTILLGIIISILSFIIPSFLIDTFASHETLDYKELMVEAFGLFFLLFLSAGPNYILAAYFQSVGHTTVSITLNALKGFILIAFLLYILNDLLEMGTTGIWISRSGAEIAAFILVGLYSLIRKDRFYSKEAILNK
ncbi:MATE family efflux transporter [Fulvivirga ligni]|uniref:MATE family efflux transporter n=1 Tax=Fulvivirga ligni TaxID=2904246 RepID=UPI001EFF01E0|nr:MATE family efflux transporter [Fulvivirga ligni]UII20242.1 polysaccharide biosynthesis C-terminal domain-containing protein [Fulvivirga ligni]